MREALKAIPRFNLMLNDDGYLGELLAWMGRDGDEGLWISLEAALATLNKESEERDV